MDSKMCVFRNWKKYEKPGKILKKLVATLSSCWNYYKTHSAELYKSLIKVSLRHILTYQKKIKINEKLYKIPEK